MFGCLVAYQVVGGGLEVAGGPVLPGVHRRATAVAAGDAGGRLLGQCLPLLLPAAPLYGSPLHLRHNLRPFCPQGGRRRGIVDRGREQRRWRRDRARRGRGTGGHEARTRDPAGGSEAAEEEAVVPDLTIRISPAVAPSQRGQR
jgi:hypothetical protein